jgi:protein O-GlcNAc transferase
MKFTRLRLHVCARVLPCVCALVQTLDVGGEVFRALAHAYARGMARGLNPPSPPPPPPRRAEGMAGKALALGYLSSDFTAHATTHLLKGVFALHDPRRVRAICLDLYAAASSAAHPASAASASSLSKGEGSSWHNEVAQHCHLVSVGALAAHEGAAVIQRQHVQVLIDLNGWTAGHRSDILHQRAAPIQALYLGYPATTGAPYMDYFISDPTATPPDLAGHFSEKLVLLRTCYYVNDHARYHEKEARAFEAAGAAGSATRRAHSQADRAALGLPRDGTLVANFNQLDTVTPCVFDEWMRAIARGGEDACFWQPMPKDSPSARGASSRMLARARALGVAAHRVVITNNTNIVEFVRRCGLADLVLDTFPINAHTVAMDVLWMGTPLLTRTGEAFSSRVASAILAALGLHGVLCARTLEDFSAIASRLIAGRRGQREREKLRRAIEHRRWSWPLFDRARQVENVETGARLMWEVYEAGLAPHHIVLASQAPLPSGSSA